jgi:hypothetical protein
MGAYVVKDSAAKTNYARYFSGEFTIRVTRIVKDANGNPLKDKNGNDKKQILYLNVVQGEIISVSLTYQIVDNCTFMNPYDDKDPTTDDGPVSYEYPKDKGLMKFSSFGTKSYLDTSPDPIAISYKAGGVTVVGDVEAYKPLKPMVADSQTPVDCK